MAEALLLLVDDDPVVLTALKRLTVRAGYVVRTASSAEQAMSCLEDVGVVLADLVLPGMNGIDFLCHVRREKPMTTRYLLTEAAGVSGLAGAVVDGSVSAVVCKPWDDRMLLQTIRRGFEVHAQRFGMRLAPGEQPNSSLPLCDDYGI